MEIFPPAVNIFPYDLVKIFLMPYSLLILASTAQFPFVEAELISDSL